MTINKCKTTLDEIKIEVTHNCLLKCIHCSSNAESFSKREMDWPTCEKVLIEAFELGVKEIVFSGGEALLWEFIDRAVNLVHKNKVRATLYTTGNVIDFNNKVRKLLNKGLSKICFSVYGANSTIHEQITKIPGSFEKTINAVKLSGEFCANIEFHFVPLTINYKELKPVAYLGKRLGVNRTSVLRFIPHGRGEKKDNLILDNSENLELKKSISELIDGNYEIRLGSPYNFLMLNKHPKCCSGQDRLTIAPDFKIFPCDAFKQISSEKLMVDNDLRNVRDNLLKDCWEKSSYFKTIRDSILTDDYGECNDCTMLKKCNSGCLSQKIIKKGSFRGPDPLCLCKGRKLN